MYVKLTKFEIASAQLEQAISLYLNGKDLISAVTLAGAADEILGKLANAEGTPNALEDKTQLLCKIHKAAFKEEPSPKAYVEIQNRARNQFKHLGTEDAVELDLESEVCSIIQRAITNFQKLGRGHLERFGEFEKEMIRRYREAYSTA